MANKDIIVVRNGLTAMMAAERLVENDVRQVSSNDLEKNNIVGDVKWGWCGQIMINEIQERVDVLCER